jgi:hypothetical protein
MPKVRLSISVDDRHLNDFSKVLKDAESAGMEIEEKHKDLGVATGSIEKDKVESLRKVKGVHHVEEERQIQIPPPDSDVQ